jgi:hypothetical protein
MTTSRYIAYRQDENNYYDDSDFYIMLLDTVDNKIIKHIYGTTRFAGSSKFEHEYLDLTQDYKRHEVEKQALEVAKKQILEENRISSYNVEIGDIVKVTNSRVRSFKEETFKVESKRDFTKFGRVVSTTLFGENVFSEHIKTSESNVTIVRHHDKKVSRIADRLVVGLRLN